MQIKNPQKRLNKFWGKVDEKHVRSFVNYLTGTNILDMGCGFGTTTAYISKLGYNCTGIDYDTEAIDYCRLKYPNCNFQFANAEELPFSDGIFDTIILRDALHHFYGEADFEKIKKEISRVAAKNSRIIIFDPNVNLLLKTMRKLSFHKDEECRFEIAVNIIIEMGYEIHYKEFNTVYSLPLSGGYVGINFVPDINLIHKFILGTEIYTEKIINTLGLGRFLCWRYLMVGKKKEADFFQERKSGN